MTTPRVTRRVTVERSLSAPDSGTSRPRTREQVSTGRLVSRPSDSPSRADDAMRLRAQLTADGQHTRNASDGLSMLGRTRSALRAMSGRVERARDLILRGRSTGATSIDARSALAVELTRVRDSLLALANTRHGGRPLFAGTSDSPVAFLPDGTYVGDGHGVERRIAPGTDIKVNTTGAEAFEVGDDNLFRVLDEAITRLTTAPGGLGDSLDRLDAVAARMRSATADVDTRSARVEGAMSTLAELSQDTAAALSAVEDGDLAEAMVDLQLEEVAYRAALGATARVLQPSLLDFLR